MSLCLSKKGYVSEVYFTFNHNTKLTFDHINFTNILFSSLNLTTKRNVTYNGNWDGFFFFF